MPAGPPSSARIDTNRISRIHPSKGWILFYYWQGLPERTILLGRTARNRILYHLPNPYSRNGRPAEYGERDKTPAEWLHEKAGWRSTQLTVRGKTRDLRCRVEEPFLRKGLSDRPVFLIVVKSMDRQVNGR